MDHGRSPRNVGDLPEADGTAEGYNPLCGDRIRVQVKLDPEGGVEDIRFSGSACTICTASASMMTDCVKGKSSEEARRLFEEFRGLVAPEEVAASEGALPAKLSVFAGVREFPIRIKCAVLPWHTMKAAMEEESGEVTTE